MQQDEYLRIKEIVDGIVEEVMSEPEPEPAVVTLAALEKLKEEL